MKFEFAGSQFQLEFERKYRNVTIRRRVGKGEISTQQRSKFPFTTVSLLSSGSLGSAPIVVASATVGCAPFDKFSNEQGRIQALRKLTDVKGTLGLTRELRTAIWKAYFNRGKQVSN